MPGASVVPLPVFIQGIDLHSPPRIRHGGCWPHRSSRRLLAHLVRAPHSRETVEAEAAVAAAAPERPEFTMALKVLPQGATRATETSPPGAPVIFHFTPAHTHSPLPLPGELARSTAAAAAVTTAGPPSCNPILSAFLFLLQLVRTGCTRRGYGGRRVQRTPTPLCVHASRAGSARRSREAVRGPKCYFFLSLPRLLARDLGLVCGPRWCREILLWAGGESSVVHPVSCSWWGLSRVTSRRALL